MNPRFALALIGMCAFAAGPAFAADDSAAKPAGDGYVDIFNGKDLTGWTLDDTSAKEGKKNEPCFSVKDGLLVDAGNHYCWLRYDKPVADFALHLEYRTGKDANSGVGIRSVKYVGTRESRPSIAAYEIQILDDAGKPTGIHSTGSLHRYLAPTANAAKPNGEWNAYDIECHGPQIKIVLNGQKVIDVDQSTIATTAKKPLSGYILLQSETGQVEFRNLRLKEFSGK